MGLMSREILQREYELRGRHWSGNVHAIGMFVELCPMRFFVVAATDRFVTTMTEPSCRAGLERHTRYRELRRRILAESYALGNSTFVSQLWVIGGCYWQQKLNDSAELTKASV